MATTSPSLFDRLFALPRELRDEVLTHVVAQPLTAVTPAWYRSGFVLTSNAVQPPICRVNRQLRHETLPSFYSTNTFSLDISIRGRRNTGRWLAAIGDANANNLRRIALSTWTLSRPRPGGGWDAYLAIGEVDLMTCDIRLEAYVNSSPHIVQAVTKRDDIARLKEAEEAFRSVLEVRGFFGLRLGASQILVMLEDLVDFCGSSGNPPFRA